MTPSKPVTETSSPAAAVVVAVPVAGPSSPGVACKRPSRHRLARLDVVRRERRVFLNRLQHLLGHSVGELPDGLRLAKEPIDPLLRRPIPRAPLFLDEAVVDEAADVLADGLGGDADGVGDFPLTHRRLSVGDFDEDPEARRGPFVL